MGRKPVLEGGKKDEIIEAALELFLEKGYEGTSVRMIQKKVGSEIGLFYYYFKSKDEVFDIAIHRFMERYRLRYAKAVERGKKNPENMITIFVDQLINSVDGFRQEYADNLHWSVRRAIREKSLELMYPYMREGLEYMKESGIPINSVSFETLTVVLTYGIGGVVVQSDEKVNAERRDELLQAVNLLLGLPNKNQTARGI